MQYVFLKFLYFRKPCIGLLSTGNEVVDPEAKIINGQIRDANKSTIINLLKRYGYNSVDFGIVKDELIHQIYLL